MSGLKQQQYSKRLKDFRKQLKPKISQMDMGKVLNISQAAYSKIEVGETKISCDLLHYLTTEHNLNIYWLITGEEQPFRKVKEDTTKELIDRLYDDAQRFMEVLELFREKKGGKRHTLEA